MSAGLVAAPDSSTLAADADPVVEFRHAHRRPPDTVVLTDDGRLVSADEHGLVVAWELASGLPALHARLPAGVDGLAVDAGGRILVTGLRFGAALLDRGGAPLWRLNVPLAIGPDGGFAGADVAVMDLEGFLAIPGDSTHPVSEGRGVQLRDTSEVRMSALATSAAGEVAGGDDRGRVQVIDLRTGSRRTVSPQGAGVQRLALGASGQVAWVDSDAALHVVAGERRSDEPVSGLVQGMSRVAHRVPALAFAGDRVVAWIAESTGLALRSWDGVAVAGLGAARTVVRTQAPLGSPAAVSPSGSLAVVIDAGVARVFDTATGVELNRLRVDGGVDVWRAIAALSDGTLLLDGRTRLDLRRGAVTHIVDRTLPVEVGPVATCGRRLWALSQDVSGNLVLWDPERHAEVRRIAWSHDVLLPHQLALSPNCAFAAAVGQGVAVDVDEAVTNLVSNLAAVTAGRQPRPSAPRNVDLVLHVWDTATGTEVYRRTIAPTTYASVGTFLVRSAPGVWTFIPEVPELPRVTYRGELEAVGDEATGEDGTLVVRTGPSELVLRTTNGSALPFFANEGELALAVTDGGRVAFKGASGSLRTFDGLGRATPSPPLEGRVLAFSGDLSQALVEHPKGLALRDLRHGELAVMPLAVRASAATFLATYRVVVALADGELRTRDFLRNTEASAVIQGDDWAAWTRQGAFDASRAGTRLLLLRRAGRVHPADAFAAALNRPDRVLKESGLGSTELVAHYAALADRRARQAVQTAGAGTASIRIRALGAGGRTAMVDVTCDGLDARAVRLFGNGTPLGEYPVVARAPLEVALVPGDNHLEAACLDPERRESRRAMAFTVSDATAGRDLYVVALGVSRYRDERLSLQFAAADARAFVEAARRMEGRGFRKVIATLSVDQDATAAALEAARATLGRARPEDVVVVFAAGHGLYRTTPDGPRYFFLGHDADLDRVEATGVPLEAFDGLLGAGAARGRILVLDACESGQRDDDGDATAMARAAVVERGARGFAAAPAARPPAPARARTRSIDLSELRTTGAVVISSSTGDEPSFEDPVLGHGVFTATLLEALGGGGADADRDGWLSLRELREYVARRVPERTGHRQHPTVDRDNAHGVPPLPIVRKLAGHPAAATVEPLSGLEFVWLPGGTFRAGCPGGAACRCSAAGPTGCAATSNPSRRAAVAPFWIGRTEVTVGAFRRCARAGRCIPPDVGAGCTYGADVERDLLPASCMSYGNALGFCDWLGGRLPSGDEWEFAALGAARSGLRELVQGLAEWTSKPGSARDLETRFSPQFLYGGPPLAGGAAASWTRVLMDPVSGPEIRPASIGFRCVLDAPAAPGGGKP